MSNSSSPHTTPSSSGKPEISWPLERPTDPPAEFGPRVEAELRRRSADVHDHLSETDEATVPFKDLLPNHSRSLSGIASRSFLLGIALGSCVFAWWYNFYIAETPLWRPPFFVSTLALFHYLEFWIHAKYNLPKATTDTFLLNANGWQYNAAHGLGMLEAIITSSYYPRWQSHFSYTIIQWTGLAFIVMGQTVRTVAMATAGTNFHHVVQHKKEKGHQLVQHGIYGVLRHPSYFGFFWWAIGTQLVLGNVFCLFMYIAVLWMFFNKRIRSEERYLTNFFGEEYSKYRGRTIVGIPLIP
ncbi:prenyl cysteine carboxyl methyltransferase Ste14 [Tothia fuscella]|uniref:Protein-S-isoprenylcysteine O-methyltransferase n=1 Tax=Tothia fuscella TaxID=1048955 RepID=A0A9P4P0I1_9PEZI|nr:prenyl cysteine carboxyl methyltransferase Ste14 [Tothia fuscella]